MSSVYNNHQPWLETSNLVALNVRFSCVGLKTKPLKLKAQVRLTDTVEALKVHLKASHDISGSLKDEAGRRLDRHDQMKTCLQDLGTSRNSTVLMTSYKSYNRLQHSHPITIHVENYGDFTVKVRSVTDIDELRHIIQDKLGMPMEEQVYTQGGKVLRRNIKVVSRCGHEHGRDMLTLIWQPRPLRQGIPCVLLKSVFLFPTPPSIQYSNNSNALQ